MKIFFGYAAGVGKTYAMLCAAQREKRSGVDIVAGYIEPHARPETAKKVQGLETIPPIVMQMDKNRREGDGHRRDFNAQTPGGAD